MRRYRQRLYRAPGGATANSIEGALKELRAVSVGAIAELRRPLFTAADAWKGGWYEMSLAYPPGSDVDAVLGAIWTFPRIVAGPVASSASEPSDQRAVEPT